MLSILDYILNYALPIFSLKLTIEVWLHYAEYQSLSHCRMQQAASLLLVCMNIYKLKADYTEIS
jgi:hypothetical protein